mmetsp:Transcript_18349/g.52393  ORF Transcript_18349/g.52393 Transcript_18349/m.52393 type:complete len:213 (-) Transcript_18349:18-656(-)
MILVQVEPDAVVFVGESVVVTIINCSLLVAGHVAINGRIPIAKIDNDDVIDIATVNSIDERQVVVSVIDVEKIVVVGIAGTSPAAPIVECGGLEREETVLGIREAERIRMDGQEKVVARPAVLERHVEREPLADLLLGRGRMGLEDDLDELACCPQTLDASCMALGHEDVVDGIHVPPLAACLSEEPGIGRSELMQDPENVSRLFFVAKDVG